MRDTNDKPLSPAKRRKNARNHKTIDKGPVNLPGEFVMSKKMRARLQKKSKNSST